MGVQDQQHCGASVPKNGASVPERSPSELGGNVEASACSEPLFSMDEAAKYLGMSTKWWIATTRRWLTF